MIKELLKKLGFVTREEFENELTSLVNQQNKINRLVAKEHSEVHQVACFNTFALSKLYKPDDLIRTVEEYEKFFGTALDLTTKPTLH